MITIHTALHKVTIYVLKVLPMLIALGYLLNTLLSFADINVPIFSYLCGMSLFPLIFLYLASYAFCFCSYHRMFLHYILVTDLLSIYDTYIGIPLSDRGLLALHIIIIGITLFVVLRSYLKCRKHDKNN